MKTAREFYDFYAAIPEEKWCTGAYENLKGQCCALGHLDIHFKYSNNTIKALIKILRWPNLINEGYLKTYSQLTPKQRILAALQDAMECGL